MENSPHETIRRNVESLLAEIPDDVQIVAAAKTRSVIEIRAAVDAGIGIIGENYVQEVIPVFENLGRIVQYHFIGHLQRNKVKKAVEVFDLIETVDSIRIVEEIDKRCDAIGKTMPVLIEVNSGREPQKFGLLPEDVVPFLRQLAHLSNIRVMGLMTMGPFTGDPESARPYFERTRQCFETVNKMQLSHVEMQYLSMGMTNSYQIAIEEGANIIRVGTKIFGDRSL